MGGSEAEAINQIALQHSLGLLAVRSNMPLGGNKSHKKLADGQATLSQVINRINP